MSSYLTIRHYLVRQYEIFDLPGIRTYPNELIDKRIKLIEHYLNQANMIVLCFISAISSCNASRVIQH